MSLVWMRQLADLTAVRHPRAPYREHLFAQGETVNKKWQDNCDTKLFCGLSVPKNVKKILSLMPLVSFSNVLHLVNKIQQKLLS